MIPRRDPLIELPQLRQFEMFRKFRLADQHDLQQLLPFRLQIRQQPDLFEHRRRQVLRFINHQHAVLVLRMPIQEVGIQFVDQALHRDRPRTNAEILVDLPKQLLRRKTGIENERQLDVLIQLAQQRPADRGFPRADLPRDHNEPDTVPNPEDQMRERLFVHLAEIQKPGIRGQIERFLTQPVKALVHAAPMDLHFQVFLDKSAYHAPPAQSTQPACNQPLKTASRTARRRFHTRAERGHVPGAAPARQRVPVRMRSHIPRPELRGWHPPPATRFRVATPASGGHEPHPDSEIGRRYCLPSLRDSWLEGCGDFPPLKWWAILFRP